MVSIVLSMVILLNLGSEYVLPREDTDRFVRELMIQTRIVEIRSMEFSPDLFYEYMNLIGIKFPEVVYCQALLETGWFTHIRCTKYNNYIGMKKARYRERCQDGEWLNHAIYNHWTRSLDDYKLWQDYWIQLGFQLGNYYSFLNDVKYAEAKKYTNILRKIESRHPEPELPAWLS